MSLLTEPVAKQARLSEVPQTAKDWLDALASDACERSDFLNGIGDLVRKSPDAGWDLLALVDQYYRRGKINAATFSALKQHLQGLMVGTGRGRESSVPHPEVPTLRVAAAVEATSAIPPRMSAIEISVPRVASTVDTPPVAAADQSSALPRTLAVGDVLRNRYRVEGVLGRGGMGTVFAAVDQFRLDRSPDDQRVAIKVLHTEVIKRPRLLAELCTEFQHLQSLSHPNIVRVHEFDRDGDLAFFTMEYLSGTLLSRLVTGETTPLYRPYALAILRDVGAAIAYAHARGVVHGDLNPANIFITDPGEVRVLDFGASHQLHRGPWISDFESSQRLQVATPSYASCQVLEGETADVRDDVYALACIAYLLVSGRHPFGHDTALKARTARMVPRRPAGMGSRGWAAIRDGLNFDRERRPADVAAWLRRLNLVEAVEHLPELQSVGSRRPRPSNLLKWIGWAVAAMLTAGAGFYLANHLDDATRAWQRVSEGVSPTRLADAALPTRVPDQSAAPAPTPSKSVPMPSAENAGVPTPDQPDPNPAPPAIATPALKPPVAVTRPPVAVPAVIPAGSAVHARIELAADNVDVAPGDLVAHVLVRRSRSWREDVSFKWWTESGTAKPGRDFAPVSPQVEHIPLGKSSVTLEVPLHGDSAQGPPRSFYIVIDEASENAALGPHTLTQITLPGAG